MYSLYRSRVSSLSLITDSGEVAEAARRLVRLARCISYHGPHILASTYLDGPPRHFIVAPNTGDAGYIGPTDSRQHPRNNLVIRVISKPLQSSFVTMRTSKQSLRYALIVEVTQLNILAITPPIEGNGFPQSRALAVSPPPLERGKRQPAS